MGAKLNGILLENSPYGEHKTPYGEFFQLSYIFTETEKD